ncbi:hypothetical protein [Mesorhizobium sp. CAU 1741]|uniref:hypothetical protein n=1 Tax=Mesorhizobium sp. CAU 1741 TaxID=3140366 RepID=UPI00325B5C17
MNETDRNDRIGEPSVSADELGWRYWFERLVKTEDTLAQWAMAVFSVAATVLTAVGVVLIWRTLVYTRRAAEAAAATVEEAKNATTAAKDAVAETRRIGEAQVRAYLGIEACTLERGTGDDFLLKIAVKNSGQSPARDVTISAQVSVTVRRGPDAQSLQQRWRCKSDVGHLASVERSLFRNRTHFPFISAGTAVTMKRLLTTADGLTFAVSDAQITEADFTFTVDLNFSDVFRALWREIHEWRASEYRPVGEGDLIEAAPARDMPDTGEHFETFRPDPIN